MKQHPLVFISITAALNTRHFFTPDQINHRTIHFQRTFKTERNAPANTGTRRDSLQLNTVTVASRGGSCPSAPGVIWDAAKEERDSPANRPVFGLIHHEN